MKPKPITETTAASLPDTGEPPAETENAAALERLRAENAELKSAMRLNAAKTAITAELGKLNARSPELLWDVVRGSLEFDDAGEPANAAAVLGDLRTRYPEQFGITGSASIEAGVGTHRAPTLTKAALARMKPSEIAELDWNEVKRVLSAR